MSAHRPLGSEKAQHRILERYCSGVILGDPWKRLILSKSSGTPFSAHSLLRRFTLCALISKLRVFREALGASGFVSHAFASKPQFPISYSKEWKAVRPWFLRSLSILLSL